MTTGDAKLHNPVDNDKRCSLNCKIYIQQLPRVHGDLQLHVGVRYAVTMSTVMFSIKRIRKIKKIFKNGTVMKMAPKITTTQKQKYYIQNFNVQKSLITDDPKVKNVIIVCF